MLLIMSLSTGNGHLDKVFDLRESKNLEAIVQLIKGFKLPKQLTTEARRLSLKLDGRIIIRTASSLQESLLDPHWRVNPSCYDIPSNSQIFGHLTLLAGLEGILYPSKFTKKPCLALFPQNFAGTDSFVKLDDMPPHPEVPTHIDGKNWRISELVFEEIVATGSVH